MKESVLRYNNNGKIAKIKVCAVPVSEENYNNAKKHIEDITEHSEEYIYNLISVITFPFRKSVKIKKSYTCIEFVLSTETMTFIQSKYATITRRQEYEQQD